MECFMLRWAYHLLFSILYSSCITSVAFQLSPWHMLCSTLFTFACMRTKHDQLEDCSGSSLHSSLASQPFHHKEHSVNSLGLASLVYKSAGFSSLETYASTVTVQWTSVFRSFKRSCSALALLRSSATRTVLSAVLESRPWLPVSVMSSGSKVLLYS